MPWTSGTASGHDDLLEKFRKWICGYGTNAAAVAGGGNTGNGTVGGIATHPASVTETITLTATSSTSFTVSGSVSGSLGTATVGTPFTSAKIDLTITAGGTAFVSGDTFTIAVTIGAMSAAGYAWQQQTFDTVNNTGLAWTRSGTTYTVTLPSHTLAVGESVDVTSISTSGVATGSKVLTVATGSTSFGFVDADTKTGLSWSRSGTTATVTWTNHGFSTGASFTVSASSDTSAVPNGGKTITVTGANTFTFTCNNAGGTSGTLTGTLPSSGTISVALQESHVYLKGLGNGGTDEIFVNLRSYKNTGTGYYNVELRGATGFSSGTGKTRINQAGISNGVDLCLWSSSIPYWFIANGRRFMIIAKVSTVYESCYAGFILPTGLPSEYPYPLAIGACNSTTRSVYSSTGNTHRAFFNPGDGSFGSTTCSLWAIDKAGAWRGFTNWNSGTSANWSGSQYRVVPFAGMLIMNGSTGSPIYPNLNNGVINSGSTYQLFPTSLICRNDTTGVKEILGDFEGVYMVSGFNNASENIVQASGVDHLVVQNTFRTSAQEYAAFALE